MAKWRSDIDGTILSTASDGVCNFILGALAKADDGTCARSAIDDEICAATGKDKPALTAYHARLEARKMVERIPSDDGRAVCKLTAKHVPDADPVYPGTHIIRLSQDGHRLADWYPALAGAILAGKGWRSVDDVFAYMQGYYPAQTISTGLAGLRKRHPDDLFCAWAKPEMGTASPTVYRYRDGYLAEFFADPREQPKDRWGRIPLAPNCD